MCHVCLFESSIQLFNMLFPFQFRWWIDSNVGSEVRFLSKNFRHFFFFRVRRPFFLAICCFLHFMLVCIRLEMAWRRPDDSEQPNKFRAKNHIVLDIMGMFCRRLTFHAEFKALCHAACRIAAYLRNEFVECLNNVGHTEHSTDN